MNLIIPANKKRFPSPLVIGLLLSTFCLYRIVADVRETSVYGPLPVLSYVILFTLSFLYTAFSFADYWKACFDKSATLIINDRGISDHLSIFSCGYVPWSEIVGVKMARRIDANLLVILVKQPKSIINRHGFWKRLALNFFTRNYGSPVIVSDREIPISLTELRDIFYTRIR